MDILKRLEKEVEGHYRMFDLCPTQIGVSLLEYMKLCVLYEVNNHNGFLLNTIYGRVLISPGRKKLEF